MNLVDFLVIHLTGLSVSTETAGMFRKLNAQRLFFAYSSFRL